MLFSNFNSCETAGKALSEDWKEIILNHICVKFAKGA